MANYCLPTVIILFPCIFLAYSDSHMDQIAYVTQGRIQGTGGISRSNRKFLSFLGIPYAKAPGRFQVAEPPGEWVGIRNAQNYRNVCAQIEPDTLEVSGSEDCLYLNVFTPNIERHSTKDLNPVLVFFADENFQTTGQPDSYGPEYFMDEDVVLVTLNYRLGAFGFLTLGDEDILPGNLALRDQVLALKWIQANVHVFGGDRMRVTLFGSGTGSISVSLHLLSQMSAGLFSSGISTTGTFACPNALILEPGAVAQKLAKLLNCSSGTAHELRPCLQRKNTSEILLAQRKLTGWENFQLVTPFAPTIETPSKERIELFKTTKNAGNIEENLFLPDFPENLLRNNARRMPWIVGVNSMPGYCQRTAVFKQNATYLQLLNSKWDQIAPLLFHYSGNSNATSIINKKIREFYFYNEDIDGNNINQLYSAISDHLYFECVKKSALAYAASGPPVFIYYFTYQRSNFNQAPVINGVTHMAELQYFFKLHHNSQQQISTKSRSINFSKAIIHLWTSFARYGYPKETWPRKENWPALTESQAKRKVPLKWYRIDADLASVREPFYARVDFWSKLRTSSKLEEASAERWNQRRKEIQVGLKPMAESRQTMLVPTLSFTRFLAFIFCVYFFNF